jgi:hypothetical protein
MKQTAVEYLIKEFSNILGKIQTEPLQDLFLIDAINKSKEMEKQQIIEGYQNGSIDTLKDELKFGKQYYNEQFKNK